MLGKSSSKVTGTDGPQLEFLLSLLDGVVTGPSHQLTKLHVVVAEVPLEEVHVGLPGDVDLPDNPPSLAVR